MDTGCATRWPTSHYGAPPPKPQIRRHLISHPCGSQEQKHDRFKRKGMDLSIEKTISLKEALCGFSFPLKHLDGRTLLVKSQPGDVCKPGAVKSIPGEGMPRHRNPFDKGNLNITFNIEMPDHIDEDTQATLLKILPKASRMDEDYNTAEAEECFLHEYSGGAHSSESSRREAYDEDDEDEGHGHGQQAQCVHQ